MTLSVSGMSWPLGCKPRVEAALQKTPGVESAKVDFGKQQAVVKLQDDATNFDSKQLIDSLKNAGFDGKLVK